VWGPLGNGFSTTPCDRLILVAGGIGQTPFLALAQEALGIRTFGSPSSARTTGYARSVDFCYGVRRAEYLACIADFEAAGVRVAVATEDGSYGRKGWVTEALLELLDSNSAQSQRVVCCGPEPMMAAVAQICVQRGIVCEVSLETPMACGIGICFSCVAKVGDDNDWDYKRTCVEGPIFDAASIVW
jgi:dihydroorotate dehydrogenase electron transfer subunit